MKCQHFGVCGSCILYNIDYQEELREKKEHLTKLLAPFYSEEIDSYESIQENYRSRAEFRIWHDDNRCNYAMGRLDKKGAFILQECPKVTLPIAKRMEALLEAINSSKILSFRLFGVEFLSTTQDECLIVMLYHRKLDEVWEQEARVLEKKLDAFIIGRARKERRVLSQDYVTQELDIYGKRYIYRYYEGGFTQPNPFVNRKMIEWAKSCASEVESGDLLEAYCGLGNFTIPLSKNFEKVLATEISKSSIKSAKENCILNGVENINFVRLSAEETTQALRKQRSFNRLKGINLDEYEFSCILVDPPRAGLDGASRELVSTIDNIIYISCNPNTLARDIEKLTSTHRVKKVALFDQFPHTNHMESGVFLKRK